MNGCFTLGQTSCKWKGGGVTVRFALRFSLLCGVVLVAVVLPLFAFAVQFVPSLPRLSWSFLSPPVQLSPIKVVATVPPSFSGSCFDQARYEAVQVGISPDLYVRQINQESGCQADICSSAGACGVAQLMPATAAGLGVDPMNMQQSLWAGAHLMAGYLRTYGGDWAKALACYNAGSGATAYAIATYGASWYEYMPLETQNYILAILGHF